MLTIFEVFIEFVTVTVSVLWFEFLAWRHVGSALPNQGWNLHPLRWKARS